jgi:hypothetical protein
MVSQEGLISMELVKHYENKIDFLMFAFEGVYLLMTEVAD